MDVRNVSIFVHFAELRYRLVSSLTALVIGFALGWLAYNPVISYLLAPFRETLYMTRIEDGFVIKLKVSFYLGLIITFPFHLYQIVAFVIPALSRRERQGLFLLLAGSMGLIIFGAYMGYYQILPYSIRFLKNSSFMPDSVFLWLNYNESLMFVLQLMLAFIVLFQLPMVLLILMKLNLISRRGLLQSARFVIVTIFIIAAILTPPDWVSQIGLALPLIILFYVTILIARIFNLGERAESRSENDE